MKITDNYIFYVFLTLLICLSIGMVSAVGSYPSLDPNMVLYYHFNNDSSVGENYTSNLGQNIINDYTNLNNATSRYNVTYNQSGGFLGNGAFEFNGSNFVHVPYSNSINLTDNFTVSFWMKNDGGVTQTMISNRVNSTNGGFEIGVRSSGKLYTRIANLTTNELSSDNSDILINDSKYHYISVVFNAGTITNYVDGEKVGSTLYRTISNIGISSSQYLSIAKYVLGSSYYNGTIDDLIIYNRTLNNNEIRTNYQKYYDCLNITIGLKISGNPNFCKGDYRLNGSSIITVVGDNTFLNFSGIYIEGNYSGYFTTVRAYNNITFYNFNISKYNYAIIVDNVSYFNVFNSSFSSSKNGWMLLDNVYNSNITGNYFNVYTNDSIIVSGIYFRYGGDNNHIYDNLLKSCGGYGCIKFVHMNSSNNYVYNNYMEGNASILIQIVNSSGINIYNNILNNSNNNFDSYNTGIHVYGYYPNMHPTRINITNNSFYNIGCSAILAQGIKNSQIVNNYFNYNSVFSISYLSNCGYEPIVAIDLTSIWKTWTSDSNCLNIDNVTKILNYSPIDILVSGNTFVNYPMLLRASAPINLTHDLTNYYKYSFSPLSYIMPKTDYYLSNDFDNAFTTFSQTNNIPVILRDTLGFRYPGYSVTNPFIIYKIHKNYLYFENFNQSWAKDCFGDTCNNTNMFPSITPVYDLTNPLLIYSNTTSKYLSGTVDINISLNPLESVYVFDEFDRITSYNLLVSVLGEDEANRVYASLGLRIPVPPYTSCDALEQSLGKFGMWFGLIALSIIIVIVYSFIAGGKSSEMDGGDLLKKYLLGGIIALVMGGIILILGLILTSSIC